LIENPDTSLIDSQFFESSDYEDLRLIIVNTVEKLIFVEKLFAVHKMHIVSVDLEGNFKQGSKIDLIQLSFNNFVLIFDFY